MENIMVEIIVEIFAVAAPFAVPLWESLVVATLAIFGEWLAETLVASVLDISKSIVTLAFTIISTVSATMYVTIKKAWEALRHYLLELMIYFNKNSSGEWVKRSTSTVINVLNSTKPVVVKREVEEVVNWDELPGDIRQQQIRLGKNNYEVNFRAIRDKEMESLTMTH
ncbi:hypothetical protein [Coleofasciculus sp. E1-EBD-02]|uniref:hypothetical protein n=1 Tax=Coleofasciculus sp. E1-EBD-02 TaxID=3068481 RepID=UPI0032F61ACA